LAAQHALDHQFVHSMLFAVNADEHRKEPAEPDRPAAKDDRQ
jgi:hypothetical protein